MPGEDLREARFGNRRISKPCQQSVGIVTAAIGEYRHDARCDPGVVAGQTLKKGWQGRVVQEREEELGDLWGRVRIRQKADQFGHCARAELLERGESLPPFGVREILGRQENLDGPVKD